MIKCDVTIFVLLFLGSALFTQLTAQSIEEYNEKHPGYELTFSYTFLPVSGSQNLGGWLGDNDLQFDKSLSFSLGGVLYQRAVEAGDTFYDIGIALGYTKMEEGIGAYDVGVSLRNPLWGIENPAIIQSFTLMAITPYGNGPTVGTGFGIKARVGYQKPVSELQAFTFFVEGQYTQEIRNISTNFYTMGAGVQVNLLFQN